jgi:hypothetical protein
VLLMKLINKRGIIFLRKKEKFYMLTTATFLMLSVISMALHSWENWWFRLVVHVLWVSDWTNTRQNWINILFFCVVTACSVVNGCQRVGQTCCLHWGQVQKAAASSSEGLATTYERFLRFEVDWLNGRKKADLNLASVCTSSPKRR